MAGNEKRKSGQTRQRKANAVAANGGLRGQFQRRPLPVWILVLTDILLLGAALIVFALFHHVLPSKWESEGVISSRSAAVALSQQAAIPAVETTPAPQPAEEEASTDEQAENAEETPAEPVETPAPTPDPVGYFGTKFADKFTDGEVIREGFTYRSKNVNVKIDSYDEKGVKFYVADIYVRDIECLRTAFAKDTYGKAYLEWPDAMCHRLGGVVAINGDFYGMRTDNVVIRNGELYRSEPAPTRDICVLYWDGTMMTYSPKQFDMNAAMSNGAYQAWNFGPMLLDANGNAMKKFNSDVNPENPRTAIGYYEPGHYCFVVVDGRSKESSGLTLQNLSLLMYRLGCKQAYNFDGGQTSMMVFEVDAGPLVVNEPDANGRTVSDIVLVVDDLDAAE